MGQSTRPIQPPIPPVVITRITGMGVETIKWQTTAAYGCTSSLWAWAWDCNLGCMTAVCNEQSLSIFFSLPATIHLASTILAVLSQPIHTDRHIIHCNVVIMLVVRALIRL